MNDLTKEARLRAIESEERYQQLEARSRAYAAAMNRGQQQKDWEIDLKAYMANAAYSAGRSAAQSDIDQSYGRPKYGNDYLEPDRPLTGEPEHYLTGDDGSECFTLEAWPMSLFKHQLPNKPVDVDEFRKFCEEIGE